MRTFFEKVSKCNQMKMSSGSIGKLYDLMSMAVKYQISLSNHPMDVVLCTLNHLDGIRELAEGFPFLYLFSLNWFKSNRL